MPPIPPDVSAFLTAAIITLGLSTWLMSLVPRCDHDACRETHKAEAARERKKQDVERRHQWHDRFRPQADCPLCQRSEP